MGGGRREGIGLVAVLLLATGLRVWNLDQNGWGAEYYTAAVRSMAANWHNFFFAAFDPNGFLSVDKPPVALWIQVASIKLFGFRPPSILLPQVLEGVLSVGLVFHLIRRRFSAAAALLSAFFLAITPVWVAVNRTNNTDSCLVLVLLLASWALLKAAEDGKRSLLLLSMALIGLAFNVKMLAGLIVLPAFFVVYFAGAPLLWRRRLVDSALAVIVLAATALPWVIACEWTPVDRRPFVGSSRSNSMMELVIGHNGLRRFVSPSRSSSGNVPAREGNVSATPDVDPDSLKAGGTESATRRLISRLFVRTPAGPLRLANGQLAAQVGWLIPFALAALAFGAFQAPASGIRRYSPPLDATRLARMFWFCWSITYAVVYSCLGGIFHFYYLATLAPALAALAGIGIVDLWSRYRSGGSGVLLLPGVLLLTAAWQLHIQAGAIPRPVDIFPAPSWNWPDWIRGALAGGTLFSVAGLLAIRIPRASNRAIQRSGMGLTAIGLAALLILPAAWGLSSVLLPGNGILPSADLYRLIALSGNEGRYIRARFGRVEEESNLASFLLANRNGERFLIATSTTQLASRIIIGTGEAALARGGFHGLDPAVTPETLARMVAAREVRFAMLGDVATVSRRMGADAAGKPVADWIRANGTPVDPGLWRAPRKRSAAELYDLRPDPGLGPVRPSTH